MYDKIHYKLKKNKRKKKKKSIKDKKKNTFLVVTDVY